MSPIYSARHKSFDLLLCIDNLWINNILRSEPGNPNNRQILGITVLSKSEWTNVYRARYTKKSLCLCKRVKKKLPVEPVLENLRLRGKNK